MTSVCCGRLKPLPVRFLHLACERRGNESSHCLVRKLARSCMAPAGLCDRAAGTLCACLLQFTPLATSDTCLKAGSRDWTKPLVRVSFLCGDLSYKQWHARDGASPQARVRKGQVPPQTQEVSNQVFPLLPSYPRYQALLPPEQPSAPPGLRRDASSPLLSSTLPVPRQMITVMEHMAPKSPSIL